jgi:hypothetical protein
MRILVMGALSLACMSIGTTAHANPLKELFGLGKQAEAATSADTVPQADVAETKVVAKQPPGWSKGGKKGWKGKSLPPGLAKRGDLPPGLAKAKKARPKKDDKAKDKAEDKPKDKKT